jgi:hypothetical protein
MKVHITQATLAKWSAKWPCSTLDTGVAYFDEKTGDLVDLGGNLLLGNSDGHEFDAYVDDHQSEELRAVRGNRCV